MRPFKKKKNKNKNSIEKKERKRGRVFIIILLYKTSYRKSKEINFLMPLHHKHCKEGATVVT
jgi:hypothetical protein